MQRRDVAGAIAQGRDNSNTRSSPGRLRRKHLKVGKELCFDLIEYLTSNYGTDSRVTDLVDNTDIWILPSMNPDGTNQMSYYGTNSFWPNSLFFARPVPEHPTKFIGVVSLEGMIMMGPSRRSPIDIPVPFVGGATAGEQTLVGLLRKVEQAELARVLLIRDRYDRMLSERLFGIMAAAGRTVGIGANGAVSNLSIFPSGVTTLRRELSPR